MKHIEIDDDKLESLNFDEIQHMISVPSSALGSLRQELINTLGLVRAKGFLLRYGWNCGVSDCSKVKELAWNSKVDLLLAGPKMHTLNGHVEVEPLICDPDFEQGSLHFEGIWKNSYEAREHLKLFGQSDEAVCHTLVGYASGFLSTIMVKKVIVKETKCEAMGDDHCHWVCKTVDLWDDEIDIENEISFYQSDRIAEELDETYEKLRIERDNLSKTYDVHHQLFKEVLREKGMKSIAEVLYETMKMPVFIEDRSLSLIAVGGLSDEKSQAYSVEFQKWVESQEKKKSLKWKEIKQTLLLDLSEGHRRVITPIYIGRNIHGYCSFLYRGNKIKEVDKMVLEQAALACSLFLLNERTRIYTEQRMKGSFLEDILNKRLTMQEIAKRALYIDFKLDEPYFMVAIHRQLKRPLPNDELEFNDQFINQLQSYFKNNFVNALVDQRSENVVILLSENTIINKYSNKGKFCSQLLKYGSELSSGFLLKMGVSTNSPSIEQISNLYDECLASVKVANRRQNLVYFDSLGLVGILLQSNNLDTIKKFAYKVLGNLIEEVPVPRERLLEEAKHADALLAMLADSIDEAVFTAGNQLKVVANLGVGFDNIDLKMASQKGIAVCNTPDVLTDTTADLAFALLMATARRLVEGTEMIKKNEWKSWSPLLLAGHDVHHKTIGIVGMGKIGETVAKRATGFDMKILYHNRTRKPEAEKALGAVYCSFDELVEKSDFIVCLTPLTNETRNMFTRETFKKMKKDAIFINVGRGPVVDEQALFDALVAQDIAGAGLDVFAKEPINADHPLLTLPNVVALPHIGSASVETRVTMMKLCLDNIIAVLKGKEPKTLVNKDWKPLQLA